MAGRETPTTRRALEAAIAAADWPNGLHDALLHSIDLDALKCNVKIRVSAWVGDLRSADTAVRERRKRACVTFRGLAALFVDAPFGGLPIGDPLISLLSPEEAAALVSTAIPTDRGDAAVFYISSWNGFLMIRAAETEVGWDEAL